MADNPAIQLDSVSLALGGREVLRRFSLRVEPGEKVVLSGPSGAGKSTVLRCVMGFVRPRTGQVRIEGQALRPESVWRLRRRMTWVAQEPDLGEGTAREAIERPFHYRANADLRGNLSELPDMLERLGLSSDMLDKDVADLSGGEKQRIGLAGAILLERPILLLDEPSSALDQANRERMNDCLAALEGVAILAVAHDADDHRYASRRVELAPSEGGVA